MSFHTLHSTLNAINFVLTAIYNGYHANRTANFPTFLPSYLKLHFVKTQH